jgi:AraC-like DNA-binding protein
MSESYLIKSIAQAHEAAGLPKPRHPLVSVVRTKDFRPVIDFRGIKVINDLYQVSLKEAGCGTLTYGKNSYDYEEGTLLFTSPGQVTTFESEVPLGTTTDESWTLAFHPDLIRKSHFADKIHSYSFFNYDVNEALHISIEERKILEDLLDKITIEYSQQLDRHSQNLIISTIELLLDYCTRFYDRQFIIRSNINSDTVTQFESLLRTFFNSGKVSEKGIPTVSFFATEMNFSPSYFSDLIKKETGRSAQDHIHSFIIERAKNSLLNSSLSISEISHSLGFEYPTYFSNLFKSKTGVSPKDFRNLN